MWKKHQEWTDLGQIKGESLCVWLVSHFHCFGSGRVNTRNKVSFRSRRHQEQEMKRLWVENFKNCSELLWILFLKEKLLLTQKKHVKTVEKNDSLFPLTYPRKENGWKENISWIYKYIAKLWLLIRNIWPCSVSVKYSGLRPYECCTNEVTEDPQESSKHSDRSFHIGIILLRILFSSISFGNSIFLSTLEAKKMLWQSSLNCIRLWIQMKPDIIASASIAATEKTIPDHSVGVVWATCRSYLT